MVDQVLIGIEEALGRGERVEIRGLGTFVTRRYGSFKGRNPRTGAEVTVKPKRLPYFKASGKLTELHNPSVPRTLGSPRVQEDRRLEETKTELRTA